MKYLLVALAILSWYLIQDPDYYYLFNQTIETLREKMVPIPSVSTALETKFHRLMAALENEPDSIFLF